MAHATRLHKNSLGNAMKKRDPHPSPEPVPDPGLVGDLLSGVGNVVDGAVSGVASLVSTVVGDVNRVLAPAAAAASTSTPPTPTTPSSPSQPTTASPNPVPSPSSGGSSSGSSGSTSGSNGNNGNSGNDGNSVSSSSKGDGSSTENNNSNSSGSSSNSAPDNSESGSSGSGSSSGGSSSNGSSVPGPSSDSGDTGASQSTGVSGSVVPASASHSDHVNLAHDNANPSETAVTAAPVVNAVGSVSNEDPSGSSLQSSIRGTTSARNTAHTSLPTSSSGPGTDSGNGGLNGNGASSSNHGLAPGIIAAITIVSTLAFLVIIVFLSRRWYRKRRERRFENWVSRPGAFDFFGGAPVDVNNERNEKSEGSGPGSGTRSARSSFGTTIDRGLRPLTPDPFSQTPSNLSDFYTPSNESPVLLPPSSGPAPLITPPLVQHPEAAVNRQSLISLASSSSSSYGSSGCEGPGNTSTEAVDRGGSADGHAQYLVAPASEMSHNSPYAPQPSPISVRPWSPSERWAFPKPPISTSAQSDIFYHPSTSPVSQSAVESDRVPASHLPPLTPISLTAPSPGPEVAITNPFADPSHPATDEVTSETCESAVTTKTSTSGAHGIAGGIEYIRRPFLPTLADELKVQRGDVIRVLQAFDDGWVQVEKLASTSETPGAEASAATTRNERGLIPMDCLREAGEPLPDFLATRRVSSYYGYGVAL